MLQFLVNTDCDITHYEVHIMRRSSLIKMLRIPENLIKMRMMLP